MRRDTDFVLEKAAWPTILLETGGKIRRANQAARRLFGLADNAFDTPLANIWADDNKTSPGDFLQQQTGAETTPLKLSLHDGQKAQFIAHLARVVRDEQNYFVLQLFKESGAAFSELAYVPAPKAPPGFDKHKTSPGLAQAAWPALVVDPQGKILSANAAATGAFGAKAVAAGSGLAGICPPEEAGALGKLLRQPGPSPSLSLKVCDAGGTVSPLRVESCFDEDGKDILLQFFKGGDKSEEKDAGENFLLENAEWPVLVVHKNGKILRANRAGARAFGEQTMLDAVWSPLNRSSCQQFLNLPPLPEPVPLKFRLKSGLPGDFWGQYSPIGEDEVFLLQLLKGPASAPDGAAPAKPAVKSPMPEPLLSAAPPGPDGMERVEATVCHKQKLDCALQLARSVALDFNNALTSILGHASLLLSKADNSHAWRGSLVEIEKSAARAAEVANDLAAFSRQEKDMRVQVAGNMNMLLERTVEVFQGSMQSSITISRQLERKLFTANFDEAKMQQALVKIFENAVDSIKGAGKINVQTRNLELTEPTQDRTAKLNAGNYICVEISDTGTGITDEVMPHIFEPFFTTKGTRHRGLGLAWVYGIVTNHGGGVAISSQQDIGATVRLYLPANRKIVRDAPVSDGDLNGTETILLVDDEDLLLTMGRMVLTSFGYTVLTANSGQKALELFTKSKKKIDVVITDLVMPNMSGRELSEHISRAAPETRIIWSSGYVRSANAQEQERYLQKPFTSQDLLRKVKQVLAQ